MDKKEYIETLIKNITYLCKEKNITSYMLGKESGVGKDIIANMKKGSLPSCDKIAKIADYLDCSVDYLLTGKKCTGEFLTEKERELLEYFGKLNERQQTKLIFKAEDMLEDNK